MFLQFATTCIRPIGRVMKNDARIIQRMATDSDVVRRLTIPSYLQAPIQKKQRASLLLPHGAVSYSGTWGRGSVVPGISPVEVFDPNLFQSSKPNSGLRARFCPGTALTFNFNRRNIRRAN